MAPPPSPHHPAAAARTLLVLLASLGGTRAFRGMSMPQERLEELAKGVAARAAAAEAADDDDVCQLYLAESTIPNAGLGVFAGTSFAYGQLVGRAGDAAFPTVDHDWHNSPDDRSATKHEGDYHWPLTNYDWNAPDIGMDDEAEDVSVTVTGFGAAPNCHFRLLNVNEHEATYDAAGLDRYTSPGAGASTPWFNRTSTAAKDIEAGAELFVDYGPAWFLSREGDFDLVPVSKSFEKAQKFLKRYGKLLVGSTNPSDLVEDKMALDDEAQRDLWKIIKNFPYPTRERQALPDDHKDAVRAIHGDIQVIEKENAMRSLEYLEKNGKCVDNIEPKQSTIPHAGRGAFATRSIPKGGLVAPAPLVHITDKSAADMYEEGIGRRGQIVRNDTAGVVNRQIIVNYMFGHPNSTVLLFPYSSNVAYINHHATEFNAELRWATDAPWIHKEEWLTKPLSFLEEQWTSGLMLEYVALRDIQPGEEVLINYGDEWQKAWDEHVKNWEPIDPASDHNNLTMWAKPSATNGGGGGYVRAEVLNDDYAPIRTMEEQAEDPYPSSVATRCRVNANHRHAYHSAPETVPYFFRNWEESTDMAEDEDEKHFHPCNVTHRYEKEEASSDDEEEEEEYDEEETRYYYTVVLEVEKAAGEEGDRFRERHEIEYVPWRAIEFENKRYTSDVFLKNSFRHEMILPDHLFPKAWLKENQKEEQKE